LNDTFTEYDHHDDGLEYPEICPWCREHGQQDDHPIYLCDLWQEASPALLHQIIRRHNVCQSCLEHGHAVSECTDRYDNDECDQCNYPHHQELPCVPEQNTTLNQSEEQVLSIFKEILTKLQDTSLPEDEAIPLLEEISGIATLHHQYLSQVMPDYKTQLWEVNDRIRSGGGDPFEDFEYTTQL